MRRIAALVMMVGLSGMVYAQAAPAPGGGQAQPGGHGFGRGMGMGNGVMGTVTEVAPDHFTVKNYAGETWTVNYSANTRFGKQPPRPSGANAGSADSGAGEGRGMGFGGPPTPIKATDIKVGDAIMAGGDVNREAKTIGAVGVMLVDPERAKQMHEMQANYGKTWLMGRVTAIDETKVTVEGGPDNASHTFLADENTMFRRHREPITLGDVKVGDNVRVEGAVKDGQFVATSVVLMMPQAFGGPVRRPGPPPQ
jgi:preprotein translocase subunit YajC